MMDDTVRTRMLAFLTRHELAALATVDADRAVPECGIVGFAAMERLELLFGTSVSNRKYRNLRAHPHVALMIGWDSATGSMQYEGIAAEIAAGDLADYLPRLIASNADHARFAASPDQRFFLVRPTWVRFYDVDCTVEEVFDAT